MISSGRAMMAVRKPKPVWRSLLVELPEAEMIKLVKLAEARGVTVHAFVAEVLSAAAHG